MDRRKQGRNVDDIEGVGKDWCRGLIGPYQRNPNLPTSLLWIKRSEDSYKGAGLDYKVIRVPHVKPLVATKSKSNLGSKLKGLFFGRSGSQRNSYATSTYPTTTTTTTATTATKAKLDLFDDFTFDWLLRDDIEEFMFKPLLAPLFQSGELDRKIIQYTSRVIVEPKSISRYPCGQFIPDSSITIYVLLPHRHGGEPSLILWDGDLKVKLNVMDYDKTAFAVPLQCAYFVVRGDIPRQIVRLESGSRVMVAFDLIVR